MFSGADLWIGMAGTVVLWAVSGALAVLFGLALAAASDSPRERLRMVGRALVNLTRGIPTSLFVIAGGLGMMRLAATPDLPTIFPGTSPGFQHVAWGVTLALALGSAGHLAEIFRAARAALGRHRLEQAAVLGLSPLRRGVLVAHECAAIAVPPAGARLIHHLHNTAFAALFPMADLFGAVQAQASATFRVFYFGLLGCAIYVALSMLIWIATRIIEAAVAPPQPVPTEPAQTERVLA